MKTIAMVAAAAAFMIGGPAAAADIAGLWQTPTNGGQVEIYHCGSELCGKLITSVHIAQNPAYPDSKNSDVTKRNRPLKGAVIMWGFAGGPPTWTGGQIYNADDGNTYSGAITMTGPTSLKLKGCALVVLCKTQTWTRIH